MAKVVVVGSGPAGLAAAEALASSGRVDVRLVTMGHILGGKACSWPTEDGRVVEHGQHVVMGFYDEMRALVGRAGVDLDATSVSNEGHFLIWEDRDRRTHHLHMGPSTPGTLLDGLRYTGWTLGEKLGFAQLLALASPRVVAGVPEAWDDLCLSAWCIERGLPLSIFGTNAFRASREAQLNWPGEISAYCMLQTIKRAGRDYTSSEARFSAGGMSALWWEPVAARIEALGGAVVRYQKLIGLRHEAGRLTGLELATPLPHPPERRPSEGSIPIAPGSEHVISDFDAAILTLPAPSLSEVLARDPALAATPGLSGISRLTTVAPLALQVWHRNAPRPERRTVVCGLEPPLGFVVDNKANYPEYRDDPAYGAVLHFVGQETGFEADSDIELLDRAMASLRRVEGYENMDLDGVLTWQVVRNRAPHQRYWNAEPGSLRHKPQPRTPLAGLFLAGDWVRSKLDFPCMETAVRSGRHAAKLVLDDIRRGRLPEAA